MRSRFRFPVNIIYFAFLGLQFAFIHFLHDKVYF